LLCPLGLQAMELEELHVVLDYFLLPPTGKLRWSRTLVCSRMACTLAYAAVEDPFPWRSSQPRLCLRCVDARGARRRGCHEVTWSSTNIRLFAQPLTFFSARLVGYLCVVSLLSWIERLVVTSVSHCLSAPALGTG